ncbi:MAG: SCP2 sterol-binding domain-containing protein [Rubrivivax sp.]
MLPFEIPQGTSLEKLVTDVVPSAHARLIPASAGREALTVAFELEGVARWVIDLDGATMRVRAGDERAPDIRIRASGKDAQSFLDDWLGPRKLAPKPRPLGEITLDERSAHLEAREDGDGHD